jgi:hypothetical protein
MWGTFSLRLPQEASRIDELARRVLTSANWPIAVHHDDNNNVSPTPFLDELERALDILPPSSPLARSMVFKVLALLCTLLEMAAPTT